MLPTLGTFIRDRRKELGLTQDQLAERVGGGVRQAEISRLENGGVKMPHHDRFAALASALEVSVGELLLRSGWIEDGQRALLDGDARPTVAGDRRNDPAVTGAMRDLEELLEALEAGRARLAEADRAMEQAEMTVTSVLETMKRHGYGEMRPEIGVLKTWETTPAFVA